MPIYEYRCKSCKKVIEVIQRFNDPPLRKCQSCSGRLEKLISRTSFQLKGGGWYASGYAKGGGSSSSKSSSAASSSSGTKDKKTKPSSGTGSSSSKGD
jgi:putative FmdB family regulatory protein